MDANIMKEGRTALVNFGYELSTIECIKRIGSVPPHVSEMMRRRAADAHATRTALSRLERWEYFILDGLYITGGPGCEEKICEALGCGRDKIRRLADEALGSFCRYLFGTV